MYRLSHKIITKRIHFITAGTLTRIKEPLFNPTLQQKEFIERSSLEDCKLIGTSGSGKSLSILNRVNYLIEKRNFDPDDIHILTFSNPTRIDLLDKIQLHNYHQISQNNIKTIDGLARNVLKETNQDFQNFSLLSLNFYSLLERDFQLAFPYVQNLKYVFIDEAQDLRETHINILKLLKEKNESKMCLVGDPCQSIYQFIGCNPSFLTNHPVETFYLTRNFRSTPNIVAFSEYFRNKENNFHLKENEKEEDLLNDQRKKKDVEVYTGTSRQIEKKILREISTYRGDKANIAILSPLVSSKFSSNVGLSWMANILTRNRIPFSKQYKESGLANWNSSFKTSENRISLTTYMGSKGREWDFVILLDFSLFKHGLPTLKEYTEDMNLYYVATTRAKKKLLICHKNDTGLSDEIARQEEVNDLSQELDDSFENLSDILTQIRETDRSVKRVCEEENHELNEESEITENEEIINDNVISNMIHPLMKGVNTELYESKKRTQEYINNLQFDKNWLDKDNDNKTSETMTVTELLASLDDRGLSSLFDDPNFSYEVQTEKVYEQIKINKSSLQYNEALAGIISENLLCNYLGISQLDYTEKLCSKDYIVCHDHQTLNSVKKILAENKSWREVQQMFRNKALTVKTVNFIGKHLENDGALIKRLLIHTSTEKAIFSSMNSIKKVNEYKNLLLKREISFEAQQSSKESDDPNLYNINFYIVFNSILQFAFSSNHNDYIVKAWYATKKFLEDNQQYISSLKLLSSKLLEKSIFWESQVPVSHEANLRGAIDLVDHNQNVYEIKATQTTTRTHILQALLYSIMKTFKSHKLQPEIKCSSSLINLIHGEIQHYKFSFPKKILDEFFENFGNKNQKRLRIPVYFYEIKAERTIDKLLVYYLVIRELKSQTIILETFIKYPNYFPNLNSYEEREKYNQAPTKLKVERILETFVKNNNKAVFVSLPGCDDKGDLLGHILPANSTIIDGTGLLKLLSPLAESQNNPEFSEEISSFINESPNTSKNNTDKLLLFSKIASGNIKLLKDYIQEYCITFYI